MPALIKLRYINLKLQVLVVSTKGTTETDNVITMLANSNSAVYQLMSFSLCICWKNVMRHVVWTVAWIIVLVSR